MELLHNLIEKEFGRRMIQDQQIPNLILDNLRPGFGERAYQQEAFKRFILCLSEDFDGKPNKPTHLLFNMATGSGKTLIMAGLILYLFDLGYRNFLFFVNSNNIIKKTKDNFLNQQASKYLFNSKIVIDSKEIFIKEVENFEESDSENINIKFTTIQQLHIDLTNTKENSITLEDLKEQKIVLIADEAHHLSSASKKGQGSITGTWENTVDSILKQNYDNLLLEFTATLDYDSREIAEKYKNKVLFKYDLSQFRVDGYSKEINLIRSDYEQEQRILQALLLNLYRQELAAQHNLNLKPVILFKAKRTIKESEENKELFHRLIEELTDDDIDNLVSDASVKIIQIAFKFLVGHLGSTSKIVTRIKSNFKEENCISANNDADAEQNQILLNTLEDKNNPIRAVFAVQKLNEGWDVLNLFDIVRLYEGRDSGAKGPGKTTIAEAQLIGRGARYFPFKLDSSQDMYTRKFDNDISNELKILEELYYHTREDSKYIYELKQALIDTGIYEDEDNLETKQLTLKLEFKETDFYKSGNVVFNKKVEKSFENVKSFDDLGVKKVNFTYELSSGLGGTSILFAEEKEGPEISTKKQKDTSVKDIQEHIVRFALSQNPFFYFNNLSKFFPNLNSLSEFIGNQEYLAGLEITFEGTKERLKNITNHDYLSALNGLFASIESEIKSNQTEFEGSDFTYDKVHKIFKDKEIKVPKGSERADGQLGVVSEPTWYVYNANYGTSEEKQFIKMFAKRFEHLEKKFNDIYLIRNERELKIFDNQGRAFEPDFILFCKQDLESITYQVFIEPKGEHLIRNDKWKEDFLLNLRKDKKTLDIETDQYLITGVPFYNYNNENEFKDALEDVFDF